ncbi:MAG: hypothetical protein JXA43_00150 [Candidatus Diapherotrites archaeon]|nr:hypothetical protein [Candidatus Diapherotrites archaeon]
MKSNIMMFPLSLVVALIFAFALLIYFKPPELNLNTQNLVLANFVMNAIILTMVSVIGTMLMLKSR